MESTAATVRSAVVVPPQGSRPPLERHGRIDEQKRWPTISAIADAPWGSGSGVSGRLDQMPAQWRLGAICSRLT